MSEFGFAIGCLLLIAAGGCSSEEVHPPQFGSDAGAVPNAKSCKQARTGTPSASVVFVDDAAAGCVGEGVECSLADVAAFADVCKVGTPSAICTSSRWQIECVDLDAGPAPDALAPDALAPDAPAE
jgi:hypothetical protein